MPNTIHTQRDDVVLILSIEDATKLRDFMEDFAQGDVLPVKHMLTIVIEQAIRRAANTADIETWLGSTERKHPDTLLPTHLLDPWANGTTERPFDPTDQDPT